MFASVYSSFTFPFHSPPNQNQPKQVSLQQLNRRKEESRIAEDFGNSGTGGDPNLLEGIQEILKEELENLKILRVFLDFL